MKGNLLVLSGPSGSGKSSLIKEVLLEIEDAYFSISSTTREPREGEVDGVNYHFVSKDEFERDIDAGFFLEWAKVHDNYYGTSLKPILKELQKGKLVMCDIDVQGHKIAQEKFASLITSVFVTTSDQKSLQERLLKRGTDTHEVIERRLANAVSEMTCMNEYDFVLINDDFKTALHDMLAIAYASRRKISLMDVSEFISSWANIE
ncbi:guanylate kinase [Sulfurospirillum barnesii]|uniref:Guanylate kinase n=1 Tax=Sulfurospirillum barnesii (strain ATCC 700032 / DSM 10660 / SES-3) TaxID=760154 RepID=I3XV00_SULBS|nr:guanylate kinase [Sulfurospirillum barnesii]AFL67774.1 guanylate kinase [Sulfurospirillum barnesii SES-3]